MDWLSDLGHWLLTSDAGYWVGYLMIAGAIIAIGGYLVWRYGDVRMGADPEPPATKTVEFHIRPAIEAPPNYHREDWYPLAEELAVAIDATTAAVIDVTETVELRPVDPLDVTAEVEVIDPCSPLYYQIRRPRPYVAETFTQGIQRAQIERALAAKDGAK